MTQSLEPVAPPLEPVAPPLGPVALPLGSVAPSLGPAGQADVARLQVDLSAAVASAQEAYRDTSRLIRLLTVIGQPSSPEDLVDETLTVLSEVFAADVACVVRAVSGHLVVTSACGLAPDDQACTSGWPIGPAAGQALRSNRAVTHSPKHPDDVPPSLAQLDIRSAVWMPLTARTDSADRLLVIYRGSGEPFSPADLQVLGSVAYRLCLAVEARERSVAIERLAQSGHRLARHLDPQSLLDEAVELFRTFTLAESAWVVVLQHDQARVRAASPSRPPGVPTGPVAPTELPGWSTVAAGQPFTRTEPEALLCVPVMREGVPAALLYASRERLRPFPDDAVETGPIFATYLGAALVNAELYQALGRSESSLRLITDSISDMIAVVDATGTFVYASPSHARELGHEPEQLVGSGVAALVHPDDLLRVGAALAAAVHAPGDPPKVEYRLRTGRQGWTWVETALRPSDDTTIVLSSRVVDERKRLEDELRLRATHDPLTGLGNRALAGQRLDEALTRQHGSHVGLLFCDLDKFKAVNDRLGHEAGDELLLQVAARLRPYVRPGDVLARFGGDEFVFVLDGVHGLAEVTEVGRRVLRALEEPFTLRGERVHVSASIGGVLGVRGHASASAMLRDADAAMYTAKGKSPGLVEVFDADASKLSLDRLAIRADLLSALDRDELSVYYQPIFALDTATILGFEALLRWTHPERGPISPEVFIPLAEETGAILPIGSWVLDQACRQSVAWQGMGWPDSGRSRPLTMSINLSANQLHQPELAADALARIRGSGVDPADVWLEVTERSYVRNDGAEWAATLRTAGVHFTLDDFGMAYSNLSYLKRFPVAGLKIDRSFVAGLTAEDTDRSIVRAIIAIANSVGLAVVAEGIETEEQRAALLALGCERGQGFLLAEPLSALAASELLAGPRRLASVRAPAPGLLAS